MATRLFSLCILIGLATSAASLSILLVQSVTTTSHHLWAMTLVKGLLQKGHRVHVVSILENKHIDNDLAQNLTHAVFGNLMKELLEADTHNPIEWMKYSAFYMSYFTYFWSANTCEKIIHTEAAKELLQVVKNNEFDVIVQDVSLHQCMYGLWEVAKGKPPIVGVIQLGIVPWMKYYIGGSSYPSVRAYIFAAIARPTTMWERTLNVLYYIADDFIRHYYYLPVSQRLAEQYVGHEITSLCELEKSISILLINSYPTFDGGIPLPPNAIEIGGLHAQVQSTVGVDARYSESKLHKFLDGADNGAIVISLGTNVNWKHVGLNKIKVVVSALAKLKQRVLWKTDVDTPMPDNVMAVKWLPQNDVLNHKNVKAIWTHGGLLSTQEAIWKGIPVVGMPFFLDQKHNVDNLVIKGAGLRLDFEELSTESILNALQEIIYNKSYTENIKRLSNEYRDRPISPLDLAIWSIEYAARNPNSSLASSIRSQSWIEWNLIDVYAILLLILVVTLSAVFFTLKILYTRICKSANTRKDKLM